MQSDLSGEVFGAALDAVLDPIQHQLFTALTPTITNTLERIDALVASGAVITDDDLEAALITLNDTLASTLADALSATQLPLLELAAQTAPIRPGMGPLPAALALNEAFMDGESMTWWFTRKSPSPWMRGAMDAIRRGIEDGWTRHRAATASALNRQVTTAIESTLWSQGTNRIISAWTAREFRHVTRRDEKVCSICGPLDGTIFSGASNSTVPAHPSCRCVAIPVS